ncbi:MAG: hypothetical protein JW384_01677 [Nitrosomonadaceae bacterium]|nr:hypothetical protein [Nitrosomonadaceae bacterium]
MGSPEKYDTVPRHLVTTSDERTWKFDRPVLFSGEWCRRYDRKELWATMDAIVAAPYGLGEENKDKDYAYVTKFSEELLVELRDVLNDYHKTNRGLRYWRIVLGHWLHRYVSVIFNRWFALRQALHYYEITGTTVLDATSYSLATTDSLSFIWACNDDVWNHVLYSKILIHFGSIRLESVGNSLGSMSGFTVKNESSIPKGKKLKRFVQKADGMLRMLSRDSDAFIVNSYLPKKEEIKLQLTLGQVPQLWRAPALETIKPDRALRKQLTINASNHQGFDQFVRTMLMEILPACYLEGFHAMCMQVDSLPWPVRPSFIFTSNNFDTNEIFKCWVASKTESGRAYYVGQHGNNYGTHRYGNPSVEESTADKFLTWGWTDGLPPHTAAFIFKTAGRRPQPHNPKGGLLLVEACLNNRVSIWDDYVEFEEYFKEQQAFVESLDPLLRGKLTIRLSREFKIHDRAEDLRWQAFDRHLKIDKGARRISGLIGDCRLVVHSYDSTGILEGLSQNVPTMAFWRGGLDHVRDSAKPYYQLLIDAGIIYLTPQSAARQINKTWEDVAGWWESGDVQSARQIFCDRYARISKNPIGDLKRILVGTHL